MHLSLTPNPPGAVWPKFGFKPMNAPMQQQFLVQAGTFGFFRQAWRSEFSDFIVEFPNPSEDRATTAKEQDFGFKAAGHALATVDKQPFLKEDAPDEQYRR